MMDFEKTDLGIDLIANAFRGSIKDTRSFSIFTLFIYLFSIIFFLFHHLSFRKTEWGLLLLTLKR